MTVSGIPFGGQTKDVVKQYWLNRNAPFQKTTFTLSYKDIVATVSGSELDIGYDVDLSALQAYLVGRSGNLTTDILSKFSRKPIEITPYFRYKTDILDNILETLAASIDVPAQDGLFAIDDGKVTAFRQSKDGIRLNRAQARSDFHALLEAKTLPDDGLIMLALPVEPVKPDIATENINHYGIKGLIGTGYSEFHGSIAGRIHNVALAAAKFNGVLIPPDTTLSFNQTLGDVSAATGYQSAYIIKGGRTILGDGGGVCQVSTTLFRAALDAGLLIPERHAHAYRVHYYEEAGYKAGLDATVFDPSADLKIVNDTPAYILIQTKTDLKNLSLTFELYGTSDGRASSITDHRVWGITPPPPDLYQDDPTLSVGVVKQVDWAAWGAKAAFKYKVLRGDEVLVDTEYFSNFRPWQAVYLKGTLE